MPGSSRISIAESWLEREREREREREEREKKGKEMDSETGLQHPSFHILSGDKSSTISSWLALFAQGG